MALIKCPECNHSVSNIAEVCPECGVKIKGNIKRCRVCGTYSLLTADSCAHCKSTARMAFAEGSDNKEEDSIETDALEPTSNAADSNENSQTPNAHKQHKGLWVVAVLAFVGILIGIFFYWQKQSEEELEEKAYNDLRGCVEITAYDDFIARFPNSIHIDDVKARLDEIQAEQDEWNNIASIGGKFDFESFMKKHPESPYVNFCKAAIDSLDWISADEAASTDSYNEYLQLHPNGTHAVEASEKLEHVKKTAVTENEKGIVKGLFNGFFAALSSKDEANLLRFVAPELANFMGKSNCMHEDVVNYMHSLFSEGDIQSLRFTTNDDFSIKKEYISESERSFNVSFTVDKIVNRADIEKANITTYKVSAHVSLDNKIDKISMSQITTANL